MHRLNLGFFGSIHPNEPRQRHPRSPNSWATLQVEQVVGVAWVVVFEVLGGDVERFAAGGVGL
jgi:hypothetical protein